MKKTFGINALQLKLLAMICMLADHIWASLAYSAQWLTCIGRLAFPIFAFQIAEGYARTHDRKGYRRRILLWALITELPFNLMTGGGLINPFHQNVLFTFWLSLWVLDRVERAKRRRNLFGWIAGAAWIAAGWLVATLTMMDYYGYGLLTVVLFWLTRDLRWGKLLQLAGMYWINCEMIGGLVYPVVLLGREWLLPQQGLALLALIPIWLYNGEQGPYNKTIRRACYAFYPVHLLVLALIAMFVFR